MFNLNDKSFDGGVAIFNGGNAGKVNNVQLTVERKKSTDPDSGPDYKVFYKDETGAWKFHSWPATTDPGKKGILESKNKIGIARLVEGQYRGSHIIRLHGGKYEALGQNKPVKVYRDANRDMVYDEKLIQEGVFGINIHKAGADSTYVENWSEGCQVFKKSADFESFMKICRKSRDIHGNSFTYTLIESTDIKSV